METSTISFSSCSPPSPPPPAAAAAAADLEALSLGRLSGNLERLLDPAAFFDCTDAEVVLAGDADSAIGVHRCILAARSRFFYDHFSSLAASGAATGERPRLRLAELVPGGRHVGREALVAVLEYLYTGRLKPAPPEVAVCVDGSCTHEACRPAIDFVVESMHAAAAFQIPELVSLFQRRLFDFVDIALVEDIIPIALVAASNSQLLDLLNHCVQKVARSDLENRYLEKELPPIVYNEIKQIRLKFPSSESSHFIPDPEHEKRVRNIHRALDSDDVHLVNLLLTESPVTLDDACAIHYAAAYCPPKVLQELLDLDSANVNLKSYSGYTPLHMACMRREPDIIVSLLDKGASVSETTPNGRNALTICKRLTREKNYNANPENGQERSKAYLCIDILEREMKRNPFVLGEKLAVEDSIATPLLVENFHMRLLNLENRVAFARIFFPSEAQLMMRMAQADSTKEFAGLRALTDPSKPMEVDLNETLLERNTRLRERLDALMKTVELGRRYFPHCSAVLDNFLNSESTDNLCLDCGTPEDQQLKERFAELRADVRKAFTKDKAAGGVVSSSSSSSSPLRYEAKGKQVCKKAKLSLSRR